MEKGETLISESDLSLIEIHDREEDEDDFLLLHQPIDKNPNPYLPSIFSFSPLQNPNSKKPSHHFHRRISQPELLKDDEGQTHYHSSPKDIGNKENFLIVSENNLGMPTTSGEPLQTRKRKMAGVCNLRKSIAWNRAFFTEEGVLDPQELSMLSRPLSESSRNFKESPARFPNENKRIGGSLSTLESLTSDDHPASSASRKVPLAKGINRIASQSGGCPQPPASYSQRRLTSTHTITSLPKLPKTKDSKADPSLHVAPKNAILATKRSKCGQTDLPVKVDNNFGNKVASVNTRYGLCCAPSSTKSSAPHPGKNMVKQLSESQLSDDMQTPQVGKGTIGPKLVSKPAHSVSSKGAISFAQLPNYNCGSTPSMQYNLKPSGLRMPSPSLGYFQQAKVAAVHSIQSQDSTQPCNRSNSKCNIPTLRKPGKHNRNISEVKRLCKPAGRLPKAGTDVTVRGTTEAVNSSTQAGPALKSPVPSIVTPTDPIPKSNLDLRTKVEVSDISDSRNYYDQTDCQEHLHSDCLRVGVVDLQIRKQALSTPDLYETKQISYHENRKLQMALPAKSGYSEETQESKGFGSVSDVCPASRDSGGSNLANPNALMQGIQAQEITEPYNPFKSNIPTLGKPGNQNHISDPKALCAPEGALPKVGTNATIIGTMAVLDSERHTSWGPSHLESNLEQTTEIEVKDPSDSGSYYNQNSQEYLHSDCFSDNIDEQSMKQALRMPESDEIKQDYQVNQNLQIKFPVESESSEQSTIINGFVNVNSVSPARRDSSGSESLSPPTLSQLSCAKQIKDLTGEGDLIKHPHANDAVFDACTVISRYKNPSNGNQSVKNDDLISDLQLRDAINNVDRVTSVEGELSLQLCREQVFGSGSSSALGSACSSTEWIGSSLSTVPLSHGNVSLSDNNGSVSNLLSKEAIITSGNLPDGRVHCDSMNNMVTTEDSCTAIPEKESLVDSSKQDPLQVKYQLNAVPFSDEWVAALEAVGEDILKMKTGAVQNSPPDKSLPEPGPWSPVKRKSQDIGPFDCTKYNSLPPPSSR
ncbi:uncharacterized protein LOC143878675 isoform X2 [Tasmannia lanceolata]|uniref:uncharacterized protein LOC143878675 isoform X2 n=1 Tax=Tasmannia lanceolata TaxID=3420 RepID=UPI00406282A3